jgi:segregation and condensation protein A
MPLEDIRIELDAFEGPLDLLLYLIRRDELEITDIPIARLAEQYIAAMTAGGVDRIDFEAAGEFLVMAATLMEIKSRMLMPKPPAAEGEQPGTDPAIPEDPRADLVRQLLAYKRYRDAATTLQQRLAQWEARFPAGGAAVPALPEDPDAPAAVELDDLTIVDLAEAFARIIETVDLTRVGEHTVLDDQTPIEVHQADLIDRLQREAITLADGSRGLRFADVFTGRTKSEAIGLFLAMLELIRQQRLNASQDETDGAIYLHLLDQSTTG